jgi:hypothetical protein
MAETLLEPLGRGTPLEEREMEKSLDVTVIPQSSRRLFNSVTMGLLPPAVAPERDFPTMLS